MIITDISIQARNPNRVNISVDGKYCFSLDIAQVVDFGIKKGMELDDVRFQELESESEFGKLYVRTLEYVLSRPHSEREVRDYLYKKTRASKYRARKTGEIKQRDGISPIVAERVFEKLRQHGHIDDEKFARYWFEYRNRTKGSSIRKLAAELRSKGVNQQIVEQMTVDSDRSDVEELRKIVAKKRIRYPDDQKFMQYLARQGFSYDDIKSALNPDSEY